MNPNDAILVGSRATKFWFEDAREPNNDWDFFIDTAALDEWNLNNRHQCRKVHKIEDDIIQFESRLGGTLGFDNTRYKSVELFLEANRKMPEMEAFGLKFRIASPGTLLAIKRSHVHHRHNWHKHIQDYAFLKSQNDLALTPKLEIALKERIKERDARGDFKTPGSLVTTNDEFFAKSHKAVRRKFEHDDLHRVIMYYDEPLFTKAKQDQSKAMLEYGLFEQFDLKDKCRLVQEEAYVIGLERIIIPQWFNRYLLHESGILDTIGLDEGIAEKAYSYALMRISTDLTKGWFRDFAIENYAAVQKHDTDFVGKFLNAFNNGQLKLK